MTGITFDDLLLKRLGKYISMLINTQMAGGIRTLSAPPSSYMFTRIADARGRQKDSNQRATGTGKIVVVLAVVRLADARLSLSSQQENPTTPFSL